MTEGRTLEKKVVLKESKWGLSLGEPSSMSSLQVMFSFASDSREINQCSQLFIFRSLAQKI